MLIIVHASVSRYSSHQLLVSLPVSLNLLIDLVVMMVLVYSKKKVVDSKEEEVLVYSMKVVKVVLVYSILFPIYEILFLYQYSRSTNLCT